MDTEYLKKYIESHPENKMAWYLLGREYADQGQYGKAKYCFIKAGEIYEVFEQMPIQPHSPSLPQKPIPKRSKRLVVRTLMLIVLLIMLLQIPVEHPNETFNRLRSKQNPPETGSQTGLPYKSLDVAPTIADRDLNNPEEDMEIAIYYIPDHDHVLLQESLIEVIIPKIDSFQHAILVEAPTTPKHDWVQWTQTPKFILSSRLDRSSGRMVVDFYDEQCVCIPADPTWVKAHFNRWQAEQEHRIVLLSAMHAFLHIYGRQPNSIEEIVRHYPYNVLPGYSDIMLKLGIERSAWRWLEKGHHFEQVENMLESESEKAAVPVLSYAMEGLSEPLEIIVDKQNHRLALVSGQVMLRNYPVGLGGDKTPEGEFHISEKVRDPNGISDGEFGSRGMTLSDTLFAIHGTNKPDSIGKDESLGCIRMLKEDIEELFDMVPLGTKVTITSNALPDEIMRSSSPFSLPSMAEETNPHKVYQWLD